MLQQPSALVLAVFCIVPIILFLMRRIVSKTVVVPSLFLIEKILKKHRLHHRSLLRLLIRLSFIAAVSVGFAYPVIVLSRADTLPVYIDGSFSSSRYLADTRRLLSDLERNGGAGDMYHLTDVIERIRPESLHAGYLHENTMLLPEERHYYITDRPVNVNRYTTVIINTRIDSNAAIVSMSMNRDILLAHETATMRIVIRGGNEPLETTLSVTVDNKKLFERHLSVHGTETVSMPVYFDLPGDHTVIAQVSDDDYSGDNIYYAVIPVERASLNYYCNKENRFINSVFAVMGFERSIQQQQADVLCYIVENPSEVKDIPFHEKTKPIFIFCATSRIPMPGFPVSFGDPVSHDTAEYLPLNKTFSIIRGCVVNMKNGIPLASVKKNHVIVMSGNSTFFGFAPDHTASDFVVQPFFYPVMRGLIYSPKQKMFYLSSNSIINVQRYTDVLLNNISIADKVRSDKLPLINLDKPGIITVRSKNGYSAYAVNVHPDEYILSSKPSTEQLSVKKEIALWRLCIVIALFAFLIDTLMAYQERRRNTV